MKAQGRQTHGPDASSCKCPLVNVFSGAAFALQQQSGVIKTEKGWPAEPQIFPSWPFKKQFASPRLGSGGEGGQASMNESHK